VSSIEIPLPDAAGLDDDGLPPHADAGPLAA
jgi:hypothetical protein